MPIQSRHLHLIAPGGLLSWRNWKNARMPAHAGSSCATSGVTDCLFLLLQEAGNRTKQLMGDLALHCMAQRQVHVHVCCTSRIDTCSTICAHPMLVIRHVQSLAAPIGKRPFLSRRTASISSFSQTWLLHASVNGEVGRLEVWPGRRVWLLQQTV